MTEENAMPSKKDLAVDALMNLHFAERADAEALLTKLVDAFEEIEQERAAAAEPQESADEPVVPAQDDPPATDAPPTGEDPPPSP